MIKINKRRSSGKIIESFESRDHLHKGRPEKSLTKKLQKSSGRGEGGRLSVRHKGGGSKKLYRLISDIGTYNGQIKVIRIEYDPYRSARIALVELKNGEKKYIIAGENLKPGSIVNIGGDASGTKHERCRLSKISVGAEIFDIQIYPESKKYFARAAGARAVLMAKEGDSALVKMPSGEQRFINLKCFATVGQASNQEHSNIVIGKAGRKRRMGIRPTVRGKAMHPAAHPHGGGEGVNPVGLKYPKTPWGKVAIGKKTRKNNKSGKFISKPRSKGKR